MLFGLKLTMYMRITVKHSCKIASQLIIINCSNHENTPALVISVIVHINSYDSTQGWVGCLSLLELRLNQRDLHAV